MIRELMISELDSVSGGMDPNYKECVNGTTAGGGPGVYPNSADCSGGYVGFTGAVRNAVAGILQQVQHGGRPA